MKKTCLKLESENKKHYMVTPVQEQKIFVLKLYPVQIRWFVSISSLQGLS